MRFYVYWDHLLQISCFMLYRMTNWELDWTNEIVPDFRLQTPNLCAGHTREQLCFRFDRSIYHSLVWKSVFVLYRLIYWWIKSNTSHIHYNDMFYCSNWCSHTGQPFWGLSSWLWCINITIPTKCAHMFTQPVRNFQPFTLQIWLNLARKTSQNHHFVVQCDYTSF